MNPPKLIRFFTLLLPLLLSLSCVHGAFAQAQLTNLSTRVRLQTNPPGNAVAGFIITGTGNDSKGVLLRALGPSLATLPAPLLPALADPFLTLNGCASCPQESNSWYVPLGAATGYLFATASSGPPPPMYLEPAIYRTLPSGSYTATMKPNPSTPLGFALVELYDLGASIGKVVNLSTLAFVGIGDERVIAGFTLTGTGPERIVIRGLGPTLMAAGVPLHLADPTLELRNSFGTLLIANDNWRDSPAQEAELEAAGLRLTNDLEAGLAVTLAPGSYTALLAGRANTTGNGLVEIYDLGP